LLKEQVIRLISNNSCLSKRGDFTVMDFALFFSLMFFAVFTMYVFFGAYIIYRNPMALVNRLFFAVSISLVFWSFGFSIANSAESLESALFWRRVSAIGWGSMYAFLLHFFLVLTNKYKITGNKTLIFLLYLPAAIAVYAFALSPTITAVQYNLIKMDYGWINISVKNGLDIFFYLYYGIYMLSSLAIAGLWRKGSPEKSVQKQSRLIFNSMLTALILGSLTDVILVSYLPIPLPQMAPVVILIPITAIYYSMKRYGLLVEITEDEDKTLILSVRTRAILYYHLAVTFMAASSLSFLTYFISRMDQSGESLGSFLLASGTLFVIGALILALQLVKNKRIKDLLIMSTLILSIPIVMLLFIKTAAVTMVWALPVILMVASLVFNTRLPLIIMTVVIVATQTLLWKATAQEPLNAHNLDYLLRIGMFIIAFWMGSAINKIYLRRLRENIYQVSFQKLVSEVSFDFVSVSQASSDDKINNALEKIGEFFNVDRAYIVLINGENNTFSYGYEWCPENACYQTSFKGELPRDRFLWWGQRFSEKKPIYIEDVNRLPEEAKEEAALLNRLNSKTVVMYPIEENGDLIGFIGLDSLQTTKYWSPKSFELLGILSNLLANGFIKMKSEKEIEVLAYYDGLTNLPNRILFSDRLNQAINLAKRTGNLIGVLFMDLDSFKSINDTMGHGAGDIILKEVAQALEDRLRKTDTVSRFGGDEFLIMLNNIGNPEDIIKVSDDIMEIFTKPFDLNGQEFYITASAGVAVYPIDGEDTETLIKNADIAMYKAKSKGKNQYVLCTTVMKEEVRRNIMLSNSLYRALERGELDLYYQPLVKMQTGKIIGLEALLRWKHPEMGMIPPSIFIPLAENNGLINSIGAWVLKTAISQNKRWQNQGFAPLRMAVNLSVIQFNNPRFVEMVEQMLQETGLASKYLELEITESIATKEAGSTADTLNRLKRLGVSISIDDFGTEYSSLNRLKMLPIDRIKIDMQFVQGIEGSEKDQAITKVIINLAKSLGLEVLAEGVETNVQLEFLSQKMCDEAQGYLYYKPMPAIEIEKILDLNS